MVISQDHTSPGLRATSSGGVRVGWVAWRRRSPAWPARAQQPVHRRPRRQVDALVEQRRPGLGDTLVDEPSAEVSTRAPRCVRRRTTRSVGSAGDGPAGSTSGGRCRRYCVARDLPEQPAGRGRRQSPGSARRRRPRLTSSTAARCPRPRRSVPRARRLFPVSRRPLSVSPGRFQPLPSRAAERSRPLRDCVSACAAGVRGGQFAGVPRPPPFHDLRVVQAFPAQQRPFRARLGRPVVFTQDPSLVLGGERPASGPVRAGPHAPSSSRTARTSAMVIVTEASCPRPVSHDPLPECLT